MTRLHNFGFEAPFCPLEVTNNAARYPYYSEERTSHRLQVDEDPVAGLWRVQILALASVSGIRLSTLVTFG